MVVSCVIPSPVTLSSACVKYCAAVFVVCTVLSCACMLYVQYCPVVVCCVFSIVLWLYAVCTVLSCMYSIVLWLYVVCTVLSCAYMLYVQYCPVVVCCMYSIVLWLYAVCTVLSYGCMLYVQYFPVVVCCMYSIVLWLYAVCAIQSSSTFSCCAGKTELAKQVAQYVHSEKETFIRLDMSEYQQTREVNERECLCV